MNKGSPPEDYRCGPTSNNLSELKCVHLNKRDPVYYYPDGGVVFLVEDVLFKLHTSLVLSLDPVSPVVGNSHPRYPRYPIGVNNLPKNLNDSNDDSPISISNFTANQFRNYLFALLGRPYDPEYMAFLTDTKSKEKHNQGLLLRFLDTVDIARQFGKFELEKWAVSQLEIILESMYDLAEDSWDKDTLLRLNSCSRANQSGRLRPLVLKFIQYFISIWTAPSNRTTGQEHAASNLNTCIQLYKDSDLHKDDPALFGCVFVSILSLGHRSIAWTSNMTHRERAPFYAAQVQLISVSSELRSVEWLQSIQPYARSQRICGRCHHELQASWSESFSKCGDLKSRIPLRDIIGLARMPQYFRLFANNWDSLIEQRQPEPSSEGNSNAQLHCEESEEYLAASSSVSTWLLSSLSLGTWRRERTICAAPEWPLEHVHHHIQQVYEELADRFKEFASET